VIIPAKKSVFGHLFPDTKSIKLQQLLYNLGKIRYIFES